MAKTGWNEVTAEDVEKAIQIFDLENPEHPKSRSTFLIYNGKEYPAKHIRGMAYQVHYGREISKESYSGGQETVKFFERLGFKMQYTRRTVNTDPAKTPRSTIPKAEKTTEKKISPQAMTEDTQDRPDRIMIPIKGVIEQKNALQLILNRLFDGDIVCEKTFPWMKTPLEITGPYEQLFDGLSHYRGNTDFAKKNIKLRCDFVCESQKLIVEYDERQHFTEARRIALLSYPDVQLGFDRSLWIKACNDIQAKDNQPANRDEVRAYYDSTRDIEATRHGYRLVRIMHGQIDLEKPEGLTKVKEMLGFSEIEKSEVLRPESKTKQNDKKPSLKIGLYLQTDDVCSHSSFKEAMDLVKATDIDILVLPEFAYIPFRWDMTSGNFRDGKVIQSLHDKALELSKDIGRAIVFCNADRFGMIMSIFANALAEEGETVCKDYYKHTMTDCSAFDLENYPGYAEDAFEPIIFKGYRIGLTICYDCNHSIFSRKYGLNRVDMIINSTGGDVVFDKWNKYNRARAIENHCFTFVTMGGRGGKNPHSYVFGFTPVGKEMNPVLLNEKYDGRRNIPGGIYVYDTSEYDGSCENDPSIGQAETLNKKSSLSISVSDIDGFIRRGKDIFEGVKLLSYNGSNIIICLIDSYDVMEPEKVLKCLYAKELKSVSDKRYLIINRWDKVDMDLYNTKLSTILKVRAMENYCAVILSSSNLTKCFQCGMNRTSQVVAPSGGQFGIDLSRTGGSETIWRNKQGMKSVWRDNVEWLIGSMQKGK